MTPTPTQAEIEVLDRDALEAACEAAEAAYMAEPEEGLAFGEGVEAGIRSYLATTRGALVTMSRVPGDGHASDCATHNMPASPNGPCDCDAALAATEVKAEPVMWRVLAGDNLDITVARTKEDADHAVRNCIRYMKGGANAWAEPLYAAPPAPEVKAEARVVDDSDEAYELGVRDGYENAVQDIDLATGGDGEFFGSTIPGRTVDVPVMRQRIIDRLSAPPAPSQEMSAAEMREAAAKLVEYHWLQAIHADNFGSGQEAIWDKLDDILPQIRALPLTRSPS